MTVRAIWAWPLGFALVGLFELLHQRDELGFGAVTFAWGLLASASLGLWLAVVTVLLAVLLRRRPLPLPRLAPAGARHLAATLALAFGLALLARTLVPSVVRALEDHPIDFREVTAQIGVAVALGGLAVGVPLVYGATRLLARLLPQRGATWTARGAALALLYLTLDHLTSGPFVLKFGKILAPVLVAASAGVAAAWLPAGRRVQTRRAALAHATGAALVYALGLAGWSDPGTRAALLHDTRVMPDTMRLGLGLFDGDGDGDMPPWLGGWDCDDADPRLAALRLEEPGNGLDDDCFEGDAPPRPTAPPATVRAERRPHVVLVTIDALRADGLASLGGRHDAMPNLEARARAGRWYLRAYAPSNHTFFSLISILSGQRPERLVADPDGQNIRFTFWLPHLLAKLGYRTIAIQPPLLGDHLPFEELRFEELYLGPWDYDGRNRGGTARQRVDLVEHLMRDRPDGRPVFLWLHLYDAHAFHEAHDRFPPATTEDVYHNELFWIDLQLARLFRAIDEHLGPDTILAVTSDHGESFGTRGAFGHGHGLHEHEIHVPLLLSGPGIAADRVEAPYPVGGLVPAIVDLLGVEVPPHKLSYPSILGPPPEHVVAESPYTGDERRWDAAIVRGTWKLSLSRARQTLTLFDLARDPGERHNLAPDDPARTHELTTTLRRVLDRAR